MASSVELREQMMVILKKMTISEVEKNAELREEAMGEMLALSMGSIKAAMLIFELQKEYEAMLTEADKGEGGIPALVARWKQELGLETPIEEEYDERAELEDSDEW